MDSVKHSLEADGWTLSSQGYAIVTENGTISNYQNVLCNALNSDLKEIGSPILATELKKSSTSKIVLQIQKIRNISAPKANENSQAAPCMLKVTLTDGHSYCQGIGITALPFLSRNKTAPGTKIQINGAQILSGSLLLKPGLCTLLGGKVEALYEKWELVKSILNHQRTSDTTDGPPPWVNFGQKVVSSIPGENFKSLASKNTSESNKDFDLQRQDAIAEVTTGTVKKVFGGGVKNSIHSFKSYNNDYPVKQNRDSDNRVPKGIRGKKDAGEKGIEKPQKPSESVSLFEFFDTKLPGNLDSGKQEQSSKENKYLNREEIYKNKQPPVRANNYQPIRENCVTNNATTSKNVEKRSFNSNFASLSLKQHLNIGSSNSHSRSNNQDSCNSWKIGEKCLAKYWEDNKYYNATIIGTTSQTCVVRFDDYGNSEEVLHSDCVPIGSGSQKTYQTNTRPYEGSREFRRTRRQTSFNNHNYKNNCT